MVFCLTLDVLLLFDYMCYIFMLIKFILFFRKFQFTQIQRYTKRIQHTYMPHNVSDCTTTEHMNVCCLGFVRSNIATAHIQITIYIYTHTFIHPSNRCPPNTERDILIHKHLAYIQISSDFMMFATMKMRCLYS